MELNFNCTGNERKRLVNAISEITGAPAKYLGAPSFAYQVDYFTIDRNGGVTFDDRADSEEIENLIDTLDSQGFKAEPQAVEASEPVEPTPAEVDGLCISMLVSLFTETTLQNLKDIIASKGNLIRKALGVVELPVEVGDTKDSSHGLPGCPHRRKSKPMTTSSAPCARWPEIRSALPPRSGTQATTSTPSAVSSSGWVSSGRSSNRSAKSSCET